MDLQKHNKLEELKLLHVSVEGLLLSMECAKITSLELHNETMTHHGLKQLGESLSSCFGLEKLDLKEVTCSEHSDSEHSDSE